MNRTTPDPKLKRERFKELARTGKVKTGKAFAADIRRSKVPPIVHKLTAWRKANRLSQRRAVAVLGEFYFPITFPSLRSWEEGRRSPNPHTAQILEKFLTDHPTVDRDRQKKRTKTGAV
jgi:DNA-binding transcriptional regulator YiaG